MNTEEYRGARGRPAMQAEPGMPEILLVENELMIALEIEGIIEEAQLGKVHIVGNQDAARAALADHARFAGAILDVNLSEGDSLDLAAELQEKGVPFAFATGYDTSARFLARFPDIPVIAKPFDREELVSTMMRLLDAVDGDDTTAQP
jgi:DNA-binding NtrC family response regulator